MKLGARILLWCAFWCVISGTARIWAADSLPPHPLAVLLTAETTEGTAPVAGITIKIGARSCASDANGYAVFDGIPDGTYPVAVRAPGFQVYSRSITLPSGFRAPLHIKLSAAPRVSVTGTVHTEHPPAPLPGAKISFRLLESSASIAGSAECIADWNGHFHINELLAPGRYALSVDAAGAAPLQKTITLEPDEERVLDLILKRTSVSAAASVRVIDPVNGGPVRGALLTLAESWPAGIVAQTTTDRQGIGRFANIAEGRLNTPADVLPVTRRALTLSVAADGYAHAVLPIRLGGPDAQSVLLHSTAVQQESEPNNDFDTATPIFTDAPVHFAITSPDDVDIFRFDLDQPASVSIEIGPRIAVDLRFDVLGAEANVLQTLRRGRQDENSQPVAITLSLGSGRYYVRASDYWKQNASEEPMQLIVRTDFALDAFEPNDNASSAAGIQGNETVRGRLFPVGDLDFFRFTMRRPGRVRIVCSAHPLDRHVSILNHDESVRGESRIGPNQAGYVEVLLPAGDFLVRKSVYYNNASSTEPYEFRLDVLEDDGVDDVVPEQGPIRPARALRTGSSTASTIFPTGDSDWYTVNVPGRGLLHLTLRSPLDSHLQVFDRNRSRRASVRCSPGREGATMLAYENADSAIIAVSSYYGNTDATEPYGLQAWFTPCDEFDAQSRNDKQKTATPIELSETIRGTILPTGDHDWYTFHVDHPGRLQVTLQTPIDTALLLVKQDGQIAQQWRVGPGRSGDFDFPVLPGNWSLRVTAYYNNNYSTTAYALNARLHRSDPLESPGMADEAPRPLKMGRAEPFVFEHIADVDRFAFDATEAGTLHLQTFSPLDTHLAIFNDRTEEKVLTARFTGHWNGKLETPGATRYRVELNNYYKNTWSIAPGWLLVDTERRSIPACRLHVETDQLNPRRVRFRADPIEGFVPAVRIRIDATGDGQTNHEMMPMQTIEHVYAEPGDYCASITSTGTDGAEAITRTWVRAAGPRPREGVVVSLHRPIVDEVLETLSPITAQAISYSGAPVNAVSFHLDGQPLPTVYSPPYTVELPAQGLGAGAHSLTVSARDTTGRQGSITRRFYVSPYLDLLPADGAVVSGNDVRISWTGPDRGATVVRARPKDSEEMWTEHIGETARDRVVLLRGLTPGEPYEFQPLGGDEPGPVRTVTRVKGLAFSRPLYSSAIQRDYNQRVIIGVRNNGDDPLEVLLKCGNPPDPRLLVSFIGEGSEDKPVPLGPGEHRDFLLGISAQDVVTEHHRFAIRLTSNTGFADEATVELHVRLPVVAFEWEDLGPIPQTLGRRFRLRNRGDTVTDLALYTENPEEVTLSPAIAHGLFPAGQTREVRVFPVLHEGFKHAATRVIARGLDKTFAMAFETKLPDGEAMHRIILRPGLDADDPAAGALDPLAEARMLAADYLLPETVNWSGASQPRDLSGNGLPDQWIAHDEENGIVWVGNDTTGDQQIDFVHADIGPNDVFEYSAYLDENGIWQRTRIVEAWLETNFRLRWNRNAYHPHDVDVIVNDTVIAQLKDTLPEGNYTFRIPPSALRYDETGRPDGNSVSIRSTHLRGGHYVVNSDFRFRFRLTQSPVWSTGATRTEALSRATAIEGLRLSGSDLSVSASAIRRSGATPPPPGSEIWFDVPVRNIGASRPNRADLVLYAGTAEGKAFEVARVPVSPVPLSGSTVVRIPWTVRPGTTELQFIVDPDEQTNDVDRRNNEARLTVEAAESEAVTVTVIEPTDGASLDGPVVQLKAALPAGLSAEASVNGALWQPLPGTGDVAVYLLLQPGDHSIALRAIGGDQPVTQISVRIKGAPPPLMISAPKEGARLTERETEVSFDCPPNTVLATVRTGGGLWVKATLDARRRASARVPLRFGEQRLEVMAVTAKGEAASSAITIHCTRQPAEAPALPPPSSDGRVQINGVGSFDFLSGVNGIIQE